MLGGSIALATAAAASVGATLQALVRLRRPPWPRAARVGGHGGICLGGPPVAPALGCGGGQRREAASRRRALTRGRNRHRPRGDDRRTLPRRCGHGSPRSGRTAAASTATSGSRTSQDARCATPRKSTPSGSTASRAGGARSRAGPCRRVSSMNCRGVLVAAGIEHPFEARIDGVVAEREGLAGRSASARVHHGGRAKARPSAQGPAEECRSHYLTPLRGTSERKVVRPTRPLSAPAKRSRPSKVSPTELRASDASIRCSQALFSLTPYAWPRVGLARFSRRRGLVRHHDSGGAG